MVQIQGNKFRELLRQFFGQRYAGTLKDLRLSETEQQELLKLIIKNCQERLQWEHDQVFMMTFGINMQGKSYSDAEIAERMSLNISRVKELKAEALDTMERLGLAEQVTELVNRAYKDKHSKRQRIAIINSICLDVALY